MRLIVTILLINILNVDFLISQDTDELLLDSLAIVALNSRIDLLLTSGYKFIEYNDRAERIRENFDKNSVYKFLKPDDLFKYTYKHGKTLKLLRITHKNISSDTIDINFSEISLSVKKGIFFNKGLYFRKAYYTLSCGGTNGYVPDFRFAFDKSEEKWTLVSGQYKPPI